MYSHASLSRHVDTVHFPYIVHRPNIKYFPSKSCQLIQHTHVPVPQKTIRLHSPAGLITVFLKSRPSKLGFKVFLYFHSVGWF